jgi:hypothetical protein
MNSASLFFVGQPSEVEHHAASLNSRMAVRIALATEVVELAQPGDLAVFYTEHFDRFRNCIQQLKKNRVATLYLIDGILEWRNAWENRSDEPACPYAMRPVLAHKAACIGPSQARVLLSWGNAGKTEIVGIPRLDDMPKRTRRSGPRDPFRLLVMTAKTPGFTDEQVETVKRSLWDLKTWFANNEIGNGRRLEVIWRLTNGLAEEIDVENRLSDLSGRELSEILPEIDAVISTPSTAMLEAMRLNLPVAALDYHHCPSYLPLAWRIFSRDSIGPVISDLITCPETKMLFQNLQLSDALHGAPVLASGSTPGADIDSATDRLERLVKLMMALAAEQIRLDQPLCFPEHLLDQPNGSSQPRLDHALVYPSATEFSQHDIVELQVELSHARREIEHVQRELAQTKSELDLAHTIFDSIEQHPVAGPIVRMRQKWLDWTARWKIKKNKTESNLSK